jgi:hypothetical protein
MHTTRLLTLVVATCLLAFPATGAAHDLPRERTLMVQLRPDAIDVMVVYMEPPTDSLSLFKARYDLNQDGRIDRDEASLAADAWLPRALQHLSVKWNDQSLDYDSPELKFQNKHHGALASAILLTYDLPDHDTFQPGRLTIHRADPDPAPKQHDFPTLVRYQLDRDLSYDQLPDATSQLHNSTTRTNATPLHPGDSHTLSVSHAPTQQ